MLSRPAVHVSSNPTRFYSDDLLKFHQPRRLSPATVAPSWRNCAVAIVLRWTQRVLNWILQAKLQTLAHVVSRRRGYTTPPQLSCRQLPQPCPGSMEKPKGHCSSPRTLVDGFPRAAITTTTIRFQHSKHHQKTVVLKANTQS